jgi:hypothetical protein
VQPAPPERRGCEINLPTARVAPALQKLFNDIHSRLTMAQIDRKAKFVMNAIFTALAIASLISFMIDGIGITSLLLTSFALLALLLTVTTPKQLDNFMDTLLD